MPSLNQFWSAVSVAGQNPAMTGPYLLGSRLAFAAAQVLGAPAAGLSVFSRDQLVRVPLGASSPEAAAAERLQFTTGEGPCLDAYDGQAVAMADAVVIATRWPMFDRQLQDQTSFRSVLAVPLPGLGALDVYFTDPAGCLTANVADVLVVAQQIHITLADTDLPAALHDWPPGSGAGRRAQVSIAMGVLMVTLAVTALDALSILRAHALVTDRAIDDLAADVVTGVVNLSRFRS